MTGAASHSTLTGNDAVIAVLTAALYLGFLGAAFGLAEPAARPDVGALAGGLSDSALPTVAPTGLSAVGELATVASVARTGDAPARIEIIVKFDDEHGERLRDLYIDSPERARAALRDLARSDDAFEDLRLERMNYSGEGTLAFVGSLPTDAAERERLAAAIVARLNAAPGVEYAEANLVAAREGAGP